MEADEFSNNLGQFTGTESYWKFNLGVLLTDGAKFVADNAGNGAYWLMDAIASYKADPQIASQSFQHWILKVRKDNTAVLTCDDGDGNVLVTQEILYTDFPIEEIRFYLIDNVLMLPSEY